MANKKFNELGAVAYDAARIILTANPATGGLGKITNEAYSNGVSLLKKDTVVLTDAQIKALPTTAIQIVASPGAGKLLLLTQASLSVIEIDPYDNFGGAPSFFKFVYGAGNDFQASQLFSNFGSWWANMVGGYIIAAVGDQYVNYTMSFPSVCVNKGLFLFCDNNSFGNLTDGNAGNTLKVTLYYTIVEL